MAIRMQIQKGIVTARTPGSGGVIDGVLRFSHVALKNFPDERGPQVGDVVRYTNNAEKVMPGAFRHGSCVGPR